MRVITLKGRWTRARYLLLLNIVSDFGDYELGRLPTGMGARGEGRGDWDESWRVGSGHAELDDFSAVGEEGRA